MLKIALAFTTLLLLCACQARPKVSYPAPGFDGPRLAQAPAPLRPALPPVQAAPPRGPRADNVPVAWIPTATERSWRWIVLHHSASSTGGAVAFDRAHRAKGWDELGYHFVIGNGTDTPDGAVEVGSRWPVQKWGAHTKTINNEYNELGIGICLVGNFETHGPSKAQLESLNRLVAFVVRRYHIAPGDIIGHGQAKATDCPGRFFPVAEVRRQAQLVWKQTQPTQASIR